MAFPRGLKVLGGGLTAVAEGLRQAPEFADKEQELAYQQALRPLDLEQARALPAPEYQRSSDRAVAPDGERSLRVGHAHVFTALGDHHAHHAAAERAAPTGRSTRTDAGPATTDAQAA